MEKNMKKLNIILLVFSMLVSSLVFAYENPSFYEAATNETPTLKDSPVKAIQTTIIKLNQLTSVATYSPQMMGFLVNREITPLFDFEYIADEVAFNLTTIILPLIGLA
jgi:phospholipid transport system substrate-binding protein